MTKQELIQSFCATDDFRWQLTKPHLHNGYFIATNANVAIVAPDEGEKIETNSEWKQEWVSTIFPPPAWREDSPFIERELIRSLITAANRIPVRVPCDKCDGEGYIDCPDCEGTGKDGEPCPTCGNEEYCDACKGEGTVDCQKCKGTGEIDDLTGATKLTDKEDFFIEHNGLRVCFNVKMLKFIHDTFEVAKQDRAYITHLREKKAMWLSIGTYNILIMPKMFFNDVPVYTTIYPISR